MRLIDADEFFKDFCELEPYEHISHEYDIDAVQVIRCKDCKYNWVTSYNRGVQDEPRCKFTSYKLSLNDYCSRGERREDEVD